MAEIFDKQRKKNHDAFDEIRRGGKVPIKHEENLPYTLKDRVNDFVDGVLHPEAEVFTDRDPAHHTQAKHVKQHASLFNPKTWNPTESTIITINTGAIAYEADFRDTALHRIALRLEGRDGLTYSEWKQEYDKLDTTTLAGICKKSGIVIDFSGR